MFVQITKHCRQCNKRWRSSCEEDDTQEFRYAASTSHPAYKILQGLKPGAIKLSVIIITCDFYKVPFVSDLQILNKPCSTLLRQKNIAN